MVRKVRERWAALAVDLRVSGFIGISVATKPVPALPLAPDPAAQ
jgi:hypothetical protein